jgi:hypothetical protein
MIRLQTHAPRQSFATLRTSSHARGFLALLVGIVERWPHFARGFGVIRGLQRLRKPLFQEQVAGSTVSGSRIGIDV